MSIDIFAQSCIRSGDLNEEFLRLREEFIWNELTPVELWDVFIHYKGGVYMMLHSGVIHRDTNEELVVYQHIWPFSRSLLAVSENEFFGIVHADGYNGPRYRSVTPGRKS